MESDICHVIDAGETDDSVYQQIKHELKQAGYVKVQCENIPDGDCEKMCLNVIRKIGGEPCPYDDNPESLIWPVKVLELDTPESKLQASQLDRELVFHTDCSYEHVAPKFVALYVVQCDRTVKGGKFQMVRTSEVVERLSAEARQILIQEQFKIKVPPDFRKGDLDYILGTILFDGNQHIRYRRDIIDKIHLKEESAEKQAAIDELNGIILAENQLDIFQPKLENNMMVLFDNCRFLHGRTKIEDLDRYLLRVRFNLN